MTQKEPKTWSDWHVRLPAKEHERVKEMFRKSGCKTKSSFFRKSQLGYPFVVELKERVSFTQKTLFLEINKQIRYIGVNLHQIARDMMKSATWLKN